MSEQTMKTIEGNLVTLAQQGQFDVIVHGCNCFCTMGSGVARAIREAFPAAYEVDQKTNSGYRTKLGTCSTVTLQTGKHTVTVVNAYTQYNYGYDKMHLDYDALRGCFQFIKKEYSGQRIGFPLIGAGLAGGDWNIISKIIDEELDGEDYTLVKLI